MKLIRGLRNIPPDLPASVLAVGNFDGVHVGHQRILATAVEKARQDGSISIAFTFDPHPLRFINPQDSPPLLTTLSQKARLIQQVGVDLLLCASFDEEMLSLSPRRFVCEVLLFGLKMREIVEGPSFTFGTGRSGTMDTLRELGKALGFGVTLLEDVRIGPEIVTSTRIRELLGAGSVEQATRFLGRYYTLEGKVVEGEKRGKTLGFPTVNLATENELIPRTGVYAVLVGYQSGLYRGVANVGYSPTFAERGLTVETHIFDFHQEVYGEEISLHFVKRLRSEMKFNGPRELIQQMEKDAQEAKGVLQEVILE